MCGRVRTTLQTIMTNAKASKAAMAEHQSTPTYKGKTITQNGRNTTDKTSKDWTLIQADAAEQVIGGGPGVPLNR